MKLRIILFFIGLALILLGFALYINGPIRSINHEEEYTLSNYRTELSTGEKKYTYWVGIINDNFFSNGTFKLKSTSTNGTAYFHLLNEAQKQIWENTNQIDQTLFTHLINQTYIYSMNPKLNETYYIIFENPSNQQIIVTADVWFEADFLRLDYSRYPIYFLSIIIGVVLFWISKQTFFSAAESFLKKWTLPREKSLKNETDIHMHLDRYEKMKSLAIYYIFIYIILVCVFFVVRNFSKISFAFNFESAIRPEFNIAIWDVISRYLFLDLVFTFPILIIVPLTLLVQPRIADLSDILSKRIGWVRRSKQEYIIDRQVSMNLTRKLSSKKTLFLLISTALSFLISYYLEIPMFIPITLLCVGFGIWFSYRFWTEYQDICLKERIGNYARRTYMKKNTFSWFFQVSILSSLASIIIVLLGFSSWPIVVEKSFFEPVRLLNPNISFFTFEIEAIQYTSISAIFLIILFPIFIGFLMFILFPYMSNLGPRGLLGTVIIFFITFFVGEIIKFMVTGTLELIIEPMTLLSPLIAAAIHKIASSRYNKVLNKFFTGS